MALAVAALGGLWPAPARAEDKKKALLLIEWWGPLEGEKHRADRINILAGFASAIDTLGYAVVDESLRDSTLKGDARLKKCIDTLPCKLELGDRTNADLIVDARVTFDPGSEAAPAADKSRKQRKSKSEPVKEVAPSSKETKGVWNVAVKLLPMDVRRGGAEAEQPCPSCTVAQVFDKITAVVGEAVAAEKKKPRATLVVHSKPVGAGVRVDGDEVGVTEFRHAVYAGTHALEVWLGDKKVSTQTDLEADRASEWDADLEKMTLARRKAAAAGAVVDEGGTKKPAPRWAKPAGIGLLAGGAALLGVGIAAIVLDGDGTCSLTPPQTQCKQVYSTLAYGAGFTAVGGLAALVGGGLLTWAILRPQETTHAVITPVIDPSGTVGIAAAGQF